MEKRMETSNASSTNVSTLKSPAYLPPSIIVATDLKNGTPPGRYKCKSCDCVLNSDNQVRKVSTKRLLPKGVSQVVINTWIYYVSNFSTLHRKGTKIWSLGFLVHLVKIAGSNHILGRPNSLKSYPILQMLLRGNPARCLMMRNRCSPSVTFSRRVRE